MNNNSVTFICQTGYKYPAKIEWEKAQIEKEIKRCWTELNLPYKYNVYFFGDHITEHKNNAFPGEIIRIIIISNEETRGIFFPYFFVTDKLVKHICCNVTDKSGSVEVGYFQTETYMERLYSERLKGAVFDLSRVLKKIQNFTFTEQDSDEYNLQKTKVLVDLEPGFKAVYATNNNQIKPSKEWGKFDIFEPFVSHLDGNDRISWGKDIHEMNSNNVTARLKFYIFEVSDINNVEDDIVQFIKSYVGSPDACAGMNILILMNCNEKLEFKILTTFFENYIYFKAICKKKSNTLDTWIWTVGESYTNRSINKIIQPFDKMPEGSSEKNKKLFDLLYSYKFSENKRSLKNACGSWVCRCINVYTKKELTGHAADIVEKYKFTDLIHFAEYLIKCSFVENLIMAYKNGLITNIKYDDDKLNEFKNTLGRKFKPPTFKMADDSNLSMKYENINALIQDKSFKINYAAIENDIKQNALTGNTSVIKQLMGNDDQIKLGGTGQEGTITINTMSKRLEKIMGEDPNNICDAINRGSTENFDEQLYACKQYIISSICNSLNLCGHFIFININKNTYYFLEQIKNREIKFLTQSDAFLYNIPYANHYISFIFKHDYMKYALLYISQYVYKVKRKKQINLDGNKYIEKNPLMTQKEHRNEDKQNIEKKKDYMSDKQFKDELKFIANDRSYSTWFDDTAYRFNDIDELEFIVGSLKLDDAERKYIIIFFVLSDDNHNKTELLKYLCLIANGVIDKKNELFTNFMGNNVTSRTMEKKMETLMIKDAPDAQSESVVEIIPNKKRNLVIIEEVIEDIEGGNQNSRINVIIIILFFVLLMYCYVCDKTKKYDSYLSKKQFKSFA